MKDHKTWWGAPIIWFIALSMGLAWLVAVPLWLGDGLSHPGFTWIAVAMMWTPALAALMVAAGQRKLRGFVRDVGLWPVGKMSRFLISLFLGVLIPLALIFQALFVGDLLGTYPGDFKNLTVLTALSGEQGVPKFLWTQLGFAVMGGVLNALPALGEEIGWRGWLWPKLLRLGSMPAILISGVVWGVWHAPLLLLGYNYPYSSGPLAILSMVGMCTVVGAFFAWLRMFSKSVWPVALAHGVFNASAGFAALFMAFGTFLDPSQATIMGWSGWLLPALVVVVMLGIGAFKPRRAKVLPPTEPREP